MTFVLLSLSVNITKCKVWNKNKYSGDHSLFRVVVPATLHSISVNAHFTGFLGSGHANLLSKYRTHPTENIWRETIVEGSIGKPMMGVLGGTAGVGHGNRGSSEYEECNIPEIDTSDSPDIQEGREGGLMSGQRLKLVWGGKVGTKDTQETWEWDRKVGTAEITRDTVLK